MTFVSSEAEAIRIQEITNELISEYPKPEILSIFTQIKNCKEQEIFIEHVNTDCEVGSEVINKRTVDMYHARHARTCTNWALENGLIDRELTDYAERLIQDHYIDQEQLAINTLYANIDNRDNCFCDENGLFIETELNKENVLKACTKINHYKDANGLIIGAKPKALVVNERKYFDTVRLCKQMFNIDKHGNVNLNQLSDLNLKVIASSFVPYNDWLIITDVSNVLMYCIAKDIYSDCNVKEDTKNIVLEVKGEYAFVALNPNCLFYAKGVSVDE